MKKLLISLMILCSFGLQAQQDVTGTWRSADGWKAEFIQDGIHVYAILNVSNFKHFIMATINGNQIRGTILRYDVNNNCNTAMDGTWTLSGNNSMQLTWKDLDGRCDLGLNQTGTDAPLTRVSRPSELPMNGFGGSRFDPNSDATGSWGDADWIQLGTLVYFINNNSGFKHYFMGSRNGNQITGTQTRINRSNGCLTEMNMTFTLTNANSMQYRAVARDGRCDLQLGWSESGTITRRGTNGTVPPAVQAETYTLTNKNSNLCLAVRGATQNNGEEGTQWACDGNADKNWKIIDAAGGFYKLQNENSNHFLAVGAGSRDQGGRVVQYVDQGQEDILWRLIDIGDGYYKVQNKNSGLFLAIGAGSREQGANLVQWGDAGQEDVKWKLDKLFIRPFPIDIGSLLYKMATVYPNPNFGGTEVAITAVARKTVAELGTISSIKVAWGYKAIVTYESTGKKGAITVNQMEVVGDRETLPIISGTGASVGRSSVTAIEVVAYTPLNGFVDMHTHLMSHLSMGGKVMYGVPDENSFFLRGSQYRGFDLLKKECNDDVQVRGTNFQNAFFNCNAIHGSPGTDNDCGDIIRSQSVNKLEEKYTKKFRTHFGNLENHPHSGIENWPHWSSATHQQMWWEWIKRAKEGGLKIMIALGVQNSLLAKTANAEEYIDDKSSVELQLREIKRFVMDHNDFMEIAITPQDLRRIVSSDKLAVILGVETEDIGNLTRRKYFNNENITIDQVREELRNLYDNYDVRYVFPIHVSNNIFGGAALYKDLFLLTSKYYTNNYPSVTEVSNEAISFKLARNSFKFPEGDLLKSRNLGWVIDNQPNYSTPSTGSGHKNSLSLLPLGEETVSEMMKMGLMIDIDHMSDLAAESALSIGRRFNYPLNSGHSGPRISGEESNENQKELWQYRSIVDTLGGMIGLGHGGSATGYVNAFKTVLAGLNNKKNICIGTDVNGFYPLAGPDPNAQIPESELTPYTQIGVNTWNINKDGFAHYGLFPDYVRSWKEAGMTAQEKRIFFSSAEYFAQMWEKCERQKTSVR